MPSLPVLTLFVLGCGALPARLRWLEDPVEHAARMGEIALSFGYE